ncbi:MAG: hypothetical protein MUF64_30295 [Polyangiaceae bacterium]|jgi:hypothetical protein|nr:hypothetical protein [Polyangiaceae bacterium]
MTSYQRVSLTQIDGPRFLLVVNEFNPDQDVLSRLVEEGQIDEEKAHDARKFVAMMLCEYNNHENAITAEATEEEWGFDDGDKIVKDVKLVSLTEIGQSSNDTPRYEATLEVTLTRETFAASFEPGVWDTAADPDGDLDDYFG